MSDDAAYEAYIREELEYENTHCMKNFTTPGSDPWSFTCDKLKGHQGKHSMDNPMGPDTPTFEW